MKYGISNIGWGAPFDNEILTAIVKAGGQGIEVAPTKLFPAWQGITQLKIKECRRLIESHGLLVPSMQSLFFGVEGLESILKSSQRLLEHLKLVAYIGQELGATVLVFGSPKLRVRDGGDEELLRVFIDAGDICSAHGLKLGIEPNPPAYGAQFWHTHSEVQKFIQRLNHPAVALHLDAGALHMTSYDIDEGPVPIHAHLSSPLLAQVTSTSIDHVRTNDILRAFSYDQWCMVEMLPQAEEFKAIIDALGILTGKYQKL